jgi:hypothetical protein
MRSTPFLALLGLLLLGSASASPARMLLQSDAGNTEDCAAAIPGCEEQQCTARIVNGERGWACLRCIGGFKALLTGEDITACVVSAAGGGPMYLPACSLAASSSQPECGCPWTSHQQCSRQAGQPSRPRLPAWAGPDATSCLHPAAAPAPRSAPRSARPAQLIMQTRGAATHVPRAATAPAARAMTRLAPPQSALPMRSSPPATAARPRPTSAVRLLGSEG